MQEILKTVNLLVVALICAGCFWLGHYASTNNTMASKTSCFAIKPVGEMAEQMQ
jgi:G:T-mismatch repair DNA endonuclease (very short patch repair protein)